MNALGREDGFSVMELLVVVTIMFILTGAGMYKLLGPQDRARENDAIQKLKTAYTYAQNAAVDNDGPFPDANTVARYIRAGMDLPAGSDMVQVVADPEQITKRGAIAIVGAPVNQSITLAARAYTDQTCSMVVDAGRPTGSPGCGGNAPPQTAPPPPLIPKIPPVMVKAPSITGDTRVGTELTADPGQWEGNPTFSYRWSVCDPDGSCNEINGATTTKYTPTSSQAGSHLVVEVTAVTDSGDATVRSAPTASVNQKIPDVTYVTGAASGTTIATPTYAPISITRPAGVQAGDLLVFALNQITSTAGSGPWTIGSGMTRQANTLPYNSMPRVEVVTKVATSSEPATYTFNYTGVTANQYLAAGALAVYRNTRGLAQIKTAYKAYASGYTHAYTIPGVADTPGGLQVLAQTAGICIYTCDQTTPSGFTQRARSWSGLPNGSAPPRGTSAIMDRPVPFAGNTNYSANGGDGSATTFALEPLQAPTATSAPGMLSLGGNVVQGQGIGMIAASWSQTGTVRNQWQRCKDDGGCEDIDGETGTSYTVSGSDVGYRIRVESRNTVNGVTTSSVSNRSALVNAPSGLPEMTSAPTVTADSVGCGTGAKCHARMTSLGSWKGAPTQTTIEWQWREGGQWTNMTNSDPDIYNTWSERYGAGSEVLRIKVTATNANGSTTVYSKSVITEPWIF